VRHYVERLEEGLISLLLVIMTLLVFLEVVMRFAFNSGLLWLQELTLLVSGWFVLLGASYGVRVGAHIGVVGDISAAELAPLLDRLLGGLRNEPVEELPMTEFKGPPGVTVIDLDVPQSVAVFGHAGILRDDPDFIPAYVLNYILGGGGFASRLTVEVREKRGLSYSVYSYLAPRDRAGLHLGGVATANASMKDSIAVIKDEWRKMAENGVTAEELDKAKRYLTGAYALRFDSNSKIANILVGVQAAGLPIDYTEIRNSLVEAVTLDDIKRVAKRIMKPDELSIVVVGRPEGLE